jgi:hypothetical protein
MGIQNSTCCCPDADVVPQENVEEEYNEEEVFSGLYKKIFKLYKQQEDQMIGASPSGQDEDYKMEKSLKT